MFGKNLTPRRVILYAHYSGYDLSRRQEKGRQAPLLRCRKRPRRGPAAHRPRNLSRHRRKGRRPVEDRTAYGGDLTDAVCASAGADRLGWDFSPAPDRGVAAIRQQERLVWAVLS